MMSTFQQAKPYFIVKLLIKSIYFYIYTKQNKMCLWNVLPVTEINPLDVDPSVPVSVFQQMIHHNIIVIVSKQSIAHAY